MRHVNFDEIDEVALQVVRADMARIYGEPLPKPAEEPPVAWAEATGKFPKLLLKQAG